MTGIAEMFAEYAESERDWFQLAFAFERHDEIRIERQRQYSATHRMRCTDPTIRRRYMREYMRDYDKQRRAADPAYVDARRRIGREANRRYYAKQKAARLAARAA